MNRDGGVNGDSPATCLRVVCTLRRQRLSWPLSPYREVSAQQVCVAPYAPFERLVITFSKLARMARYLLCQTPLNRHRTASYASSGIGSSGAPQSRGMFAVPRPGSSIGPADHIPAAHGSVSYPYSHKESTDRTIALFQIRHRRVQTAQRIVALRSAWDAGSHAEAAAHDVRKWAARLVRRVDCGDAAERAEEKPNDVHDPVQGTGPATDHERPVWGEVLDGEEDLGVYQPCGTVPADDVVRHHDRSVCGDQVKSPFRALTYIRLLSSQ